MCSTSRFLITLQCMLCSYAPLHTPHSLIFQAPHFSVDLWNLLWSICVTGERDTSYLVMSYCLLEALYVVSLNYMCQYNATAITVAKAPIVIRRGWLRGSYFSQASKMLNFIVARLVVLDVFPACLCVVLFLHRLHH